MNEDLDDWIKQAEEDYEEAKWALRAIEEEYHTALAHNKRMMDRLSDLILRKKNGE